MTINFKLMANKKKISGKYLLRKIIMLITQILTGYPAGEKI